MQSVFTLTANTLIRLRGCLCCFKSLLGIQIRKYVFSWLNLFYMIELPMQIQLPVAYSVAGCQFSCRLPVQLSVQLPVKLPIRLPVADSIAGC